MPPHVVSAETTRRAWPRLLVSAIGLAVLLVATLTLLRAGVLYLVYAKILHWTVAATGMEVGLARAVTLILLALALLIPWHVILIPFHPDAKRVLLGLLLMAAGTSIALHLLTQDVFFSHTDGEPLKYYVRTLEGFTLSSTPGIHPVFGIPYKPITPQVARDYLRWKEGGKLPMPEAPKGRYFDPSTGEPLAWYAKTPSGAREVFSLPGYHPTYGTQLKPFTPEAVAAYEQQEQERARQRQEETRIREAKAQAEARRKERADALRKAREEEARRAAKAAHMRESLKLGRYLLPDPPPSGTVDGHRFTLTEVDLTGAAMLLHLDVENVGSNPSAAPPDTSSRRRIRLHLILPDGTAVAYSGIRPKGGAVAENSDAVLFPPRGMRGAIVLQFPALDPATQTFTLVVNDQPLFSGMNLRIFPFLAF